MRMCLGNACLVLISTLFALAVSEGLLRLWGKYDFAAEAALEGHELRIYSTIPFSRKLRRNPDTGEQHTLVYNSMGLRQSRDFSEKDLSERRNILFFGDSFLENINLKTPTMVTEVLDYLLNETGEKFNVLNFGISGYGIGQSYLYYQSVMDKIKAEYVFYVHTNNDFDDLRKRGLFRLHSTGELVASAPRKRHWLKRLLAKCHLTYLTIETVQRLPNISQRPKKVRDARRRLWIEQQPEAERARFDWHSRQIERYFEQGGHLAEGPANTLRLFKAILQKWSEAAERRGAKFVVVLLPRFHNPRLAEDVFGSYSLVNLGAILQEKFGKYSVETHHRLHLKRDPHWNERGNFEAAKVLFRFLERDASLGVIPPDQLDIRLTRYFSSFQGGWFPPDLRPPTVPTEWAANVRRRYIPLESSARS